MKRLYALVLAAVMLLAVLPVMSRASVAAESPVVTVSSAEGYTGSEVRVSVSISDNPGITAFRFRLQYDHDLLELIDAEFPRIFSSSATGGNLSADPYVMSWWSTASENESANGVFAELTFRIKDHVKTGTTPLKISYDQADVFDIHFRDVSLATVDGQVSMICEHQWDALDLQCEKCGERRLLGFMQMRTSEDPTKRDYRFFVEASGELFQSINEMVLTVDFMDADGNRLRAEPISLTVDTVYKRVRAGDDYYTPRAEGDYLGGVVVRNVPASAGIKRITMTATVTKGDVQITYLLGTAELP